MYAKMKSNFKLHAVDSPARGIVPAHGLNAPTGTAMPTCARTHRKRCAGGTRNSPQETVVSGYPTEAPNTDGSLHFSLDTGSIATGFQTETESRPYPPMRMPTLLGDAARVHPRHPAGLSHQQSPHAAADLHLSGGGTGRCERGRGQDRRCIGNAAAVPAGGLANAFPAAVQRRAGAARAAPSTWISRMVRDCDIWRTSARESCRSTTLS